MKNKIAHIAIAVNDIQPAREFFELITGNKSHEPHIVESQKVNVSFIPIGDTSIELLEPTNEDSPISKFLSNKTGGIHHICIESRNFDSLIQEMKIKGIRTLGDPFIGAKGCRVIFFHPKDTYGVLIELEETK
ncbi:MAG: methylmalonyl-CoA epimerase [Candidatus Heimdallarchaeota archaeon]|nr:methylmalonyl-CoA epimerase [Candidatus Heimdallarchaeota archaeon]